MCFEIVIIAFKTKNKKSLQVEFLQQFEMLEALETLQSISRQVDLFETREFNETIAEMCELLLIGARQSDRLYVILKINNKKLIINCYV